MIFYKRARRLKRLHQNFLSLISLFLFFSIGVMSTPFALAWGINKRNAQPQNKATYIVEGCNDGDTCRVRNSDNITLKIRLAGIDAPETSHKKGNKKTDAQPLALESKNYLNEQVKGKTISLNTIGVDFFNRNLSEIFIDGKNINLGMIENGFAEVYRGKMPEGLNAEAYRSAEAEAKKQKKGIWGLPRYESPKEFRRENK